MAHLHHQRKRNQSLKFNKTMTQQELFSIMYNNPKQLQTDEMVATIEVNKKIHDLLIVLNKHKSSNANDRIDIKKLREMSVSKHGLVNEEIRRIAWPILLNAEVFTEMSREQMKLDSSWNSIAKKPNKESDQILKDIKRTFNTYDECKTWNKPTK